MKQTAIDWLVKEFNLENYKTTVRFVKQMEKEQMIEFAEDYIDYHCYADFDNQITYDKTAEEYFNETYKGDNND